MELINQHLTRQSELIPTEVMGEPITIIGAGAIGGWTALSLAKMGFGNLRVIDFDKVEIENMNSQFYRFKDIGKLKVEALWELVTDFTRIDIQRSNERYDGWLIPGIVIAAVDSMEVRKLIYDNHVASRVTKLLIDPRMGAETALMFAVQPHDKVAMANYAKSLYSDVSAVQERCTAKATIYTANLLSGMVVKTVKDFLCSPEYVKNMQWDISKDAFQAWRTAR